MALKVVGVIPARFASTRFPGKPLAPIAGVSLLERVYRQAEKSSAFAELVAATEDERVMEHCAKRRMKAQLTSDQHQSGTDRMGEVAGYYPADAYVNIQGDEPLVSPQALLALVAQASAANAEIATLVTPLSTDEDGALDDPNTVKAVIAADGRALYFSRSRIPYPRRAEHARYFQHIGVYYYRKDILERFVALPESQLELAESLEQLRALEAGIRILAVECAYRPISVDVPEDVALVEAELARRGSAG